MVSFNHKYDYILLDLDGTLVESPKKRFLLYNTIGLFKRFVKVFGYLRTVSIVTKAVSSMLNNDTDQVNYERLVEMCHHESKAPKEIIQKELEHYYHQDFLAWQKLFTPVPGAVEFVKKAKAKGKKVFVWTNPIWPEFNVKKRLEWGGFDVTDFSGFTHSQNSTGCKPHVHYFQTSLKLFNLDPTRCVFVGDSEYKDGPARLVGVETVILSSNKEKSWKELSENLLI